MFNHGNRHSIDYSCILYFKDFHHHYQIKRIILIRGAHILIYLLVLPTLTQKKVSFSRIEFAVFD